MAQPYSTAQQVLNGALTKLATSAAWNLTDPGALAIQDITYTQLTGGLPAPVSVAYVPGGVAGSEVVTVSGQAIKVKLQTGVSTATQVLAAINASVAALLLVSAAITGTAGTAQVSTSSPQLITGQVAQRVAEADRVIDAKLAGLEVALPFTTNPPLLTDLSVLYARYACFRDLYSGGDPRADNPMARHFLELFDARWKALEEGWEKLVGTDGAQVASTKFATLTTIYPYSSAGTVGGQSGDLYPNYPSGPYPDAPGVDCAGGTQ